ncbi:hypothetical protein DRH14_02235 [Candidatus Shapirobacteria bacterium]|nr:MAG: hypothetical protein DRH14_02235 [Candidatus Shapirobacteria bacterium]
MSSSSILQITQQLHQLNKKFVDYSTIARLSHQNNPNTIQKITSRLLQKKIITKLANAKYLFNQSSTTKFEISNYLYQPSYISLQSALSFYGILPQFTYSITAITTKKTKKIISQQQEFTYSHIKTQLFHHYHKQNGFLIATPEKALFDSLYFQSKGLVSLNLDELDLKLINLSLFNQVCQDYPKLKIKL